MTDGDDSIEEKRVYGESAGATDLLVAAGMGLVAVRVADGRVGEFGVTRRCSSRDVAASGDRVAVATDEDVLLAADGRDGDAFEPAGFGPAVAVGFDDGAPLAASPDGRIARSSPAPEPTGSVDWETIGTLEDAVAAIDGPLVATEGGVYRVDDGLSHAGLSAVRDVSAVGVPLAATAEGLYALGNGWMDALSGDFRVVDSDGDAAHAATPAALFERRDGGWHEVTLPTDEPVVDATYADRPYAITRQGTLLAASEEGDWRATPLGLSGVVGLVAV